MSYQSGPFKSHVAQHVLHPLIVRITHWLNAIAIIVMIGSRWRIYDRQPLFGFTFPVWMTLDMQTALHPQTIMAFTFADQLLPRKFGYPMKIRIPTKRR